MMSLRRCGCDGSELPERARRKPDCVSSGIKERLPLARPSSDRMILRRSPAFPARVWLGGYNLLVGHRALCCTLTGRVSGRGDKALLRADVPGRCAEAAVIASAAKQSSFHHKAGLLRRLAPSANASRLSQAMTECVIGDDREPQTVA